MAETCQICKKKIGLMDIEYTREGLIMHYQCIPTFEADPEKYGGKAKKELTPSEEEELEESAFGYGENEGSFKDVKASLKEDKLKFRKKNKGMVLTDIDLPFGRVFWVTVQFFGASLLIAIPIWIIFFLIVSN